MRISIVIPVYNSYEYLERCMDSVFASDLSDCEVILVDDGSTDGKSGMLCDEIASKNAEVVRVIHQQNKGLGGARNTGIENASGDYLFFIDSDDWLVPKAIERLKDAISKSNPDIVAFNMRTDDGEGNGREVCMNHVQKDEPFHLEEVPEFLLSLPNTWARLWKKDLFTESNIRFPEHAWYEDIRTTCKLFAVAESIVTIDDVLYYYYQREGSIMKSGNVQRNCEIIEAFEDIVKWYKEQELFSKYPN